MHLKVLITQNKSRKKIDSNEYQMIKTNYWYYILHTESKGVKVEVCVFELP